MSDPALRHLANGARRSRRLPRGSRCAVCDGTRQLIQTPGGAIHCYEHLEGAAASVELDHPAGYVNVGGFVVPLRANAHREVTEWRRLLGMDRWPSAEGEALLVLAHLLAGLGTLLVLFAEWLVAYVDAMHSGLPPPPFPFVS